MKLLILEDDPVVVGALESALIPRWPFDIHVVSSCADALFQLSGPHYIPFFLVDLNLPDGDGLNVLKVAFERGLVAFTQSAIMTSCAQHRSVLRARSIGIQHFLVKPVQPDSLNAVLQCILDGEQFNAGDLSALASEFKLHDIKNLTDSQVQLLYQRCILQGNHSIARAITRIRYYLSKPYRKMGELEDAWLSLQRHCEFLKSSPSNNSVGV